MGRRYLTLDHWRGFAALTVVGFHATFPWRGGVHPPGTGWIARLSAQGWAGVHLFFVISGYCVGQLALQAIRNGDRPGRFLANRFLRIFPPYWCACLFAAAVALVALPVNHTALFAHPPGYGALPGSPGSLFRHVFLLDLFYDGSGGYLLVAWTLSWELTFYVVVALLIYLARVARTQIAVGLGLALAIAGTCSELSAHRPLLTGWAEFTCGGCVLAAQVAKEEGRPAWPWLIFITGLGCSAWFASDVSRMLPLAATFALALHWLKPYDARLANLPGARWLGAIGVMSYSLYLTHAPVVNAARNLLARTIPPESLWFFLVLLGAIGAALAVARIFYRWVEAPWERRRKSFVGSPPPRSRIVP